eukprot:6281566-Pyramimonas_sp.AAC.1
MEVGITTSVGSPRHAPVKDNAVLDYDGGCQAPYPKVNTIQHCIHGIITTTQHQSMRDNTRASRAPTTKPPGHLPSSHSGQVCGLSYTNPSVLATAVLEWFTSYI